MIGQTIPYGDYLVSGVKFPYIIVTVMSNKFDFVTFSPN